MDTHDTYMDRHMDATVIWYNETKVCRNPEGPGLWQPVRNKSAIRGLRVLTDSTSSWLRCLTYLEHMATNLDYD